MTILIEPRQELRNKPRLAGACFAGQAHDLSLAALHAVEGREQLVEFLGAPDHGAGKPVGRKAARRLGLGECAEQSVDDHRLGFAAQRQFAGGLEGEAMPGQGMGGSRHQDRTRCCRPEKSGGRVHSVAAHIVGRAGGGAEAAGHDGPGVHGDVQGHRLADAPGPLLAQSRGAGQHVERRVESPLGIVLMGDRRAEEGKDGVAEELHHKAAVTCDRLSERLE